MPVRCSVYWRRLRATKAVNRRRVAQQSRNLEVLCGRAEVKILHSTKPRRQTVDPRAILPPLAVALPGTPARTVADPRASRYLARKEDRLDALPQTTRLPDAHQGPDFESPGRRRRERRAVRLVRV